MYKFTKLLLVMMVLLAGSFYSVASPAAEESPKVFSDVGIDPVLGAQVPLDLIFTDETGKSAPLSTFFDGTRPVALVLSYYGCPMLCGLVLNAARDSLQKLGWMPGDHYRIVTISIDPKENSALAAAKKQSIIGAGTVEDFRKSATTHWDFLVGKGGSERRLADAVGFRYKWDKEEEQWAHGAALFILSPTGKLSRVLYGLDFPPRDLKLALLEAADGKIGTIAEKLMLFCYHYDPKGNKYAILATRLMSLGGAVTVTALLLVYLLWFASHRRKGNACPVSP